MIDITFALLIIAGLAAVFGLLLGFSAIKFKVESDPIVEKIDNILPQTQCGQCGYPGCRPYAIAISNGDAINKCPPGGQIVIEQLAQLMGVDPSESDFDEDKSIKKVAFIIESDCIGCTKCIQACPVDAIVGCTKSMHTVITDACTGCDLCVAPCPTDCIEMRPVSVPSKKWELESNTLDVLEITEENHNEAKPV